MTMDDDIIIHHHPSSSITVHQIPSSLRNTGKLQNQPYRNKRFWVLGNGHWVFLINYAAGRQWGSEQEAQAKQQTNFLKGFLE